MVTTENRKKRIRNPLFKRPIRDLRRETGKYLALFLFLTMMIALTSGFLVADNSLRRAYDESFAKYGIEDGHFVLTEEADSNRLERLEEKYEMRLHPLFCKEEVTDDDHTVRLFRERKEINKVCLMKGAMPQRKEEIAIDRLYAKNNDLAIGDPFVIAGQRYEISGLVALSDYSALFKSNADVMFDASRFAVAVTTDAGYERVGDGREKYVYAWKNDGGRSKEEVRKQEEDLTKELAGTGMLEDIVAQEHNQAIVFTGNDLGSDKMVMTIFLYVLIVVFAFIFAVTTRSTMEQEAATIGTLRASGYTRGELLRHYLILPIGVTLVAALVGNALGYTVLKKMMAELYYNSYSLTAYKTLWNADAFVRTTVVPVLMIALVNFVLIGGLLRNRPVDFMRRNLSRKKRSRAVKLPNWNFLTRIRIRIILQNLASYLIMVIGISMASILLIYGLALKPMLNEFHDDVMASKISSYQYVLKRPAETEHEGAEKYGLRALVYHAEQKDEDITVYGIKEESRYLDRKEFLAEPLSGKKEKEAPAVVVSDGYIEKYGLSIGDRIVLRDEHTKKSYAFTIKGSCHYAASLSVFVSDTRFNEIFGNPEGFYNGYFSDEKLTDLDEKAIATIITTNDLTAVSNQLIDSMGGMFLFIRTFAVLLYVIVIYLLSRQVLAKNESSIAMFKILGYSDREAGKLYNRATALVVLFGLLVSLPVSGWAMENLYHFAMFKINGWVCFRLVWWIYPTIFVLGASAYLVVSFLQMRRIRRIPMSRALKELV